MRSKSEAGFAFWCCVVAMAMLMVAAILIAHAHAAEPAPAPAKTITYTLTQDQVNTLYGAMVAADFWLQVRGLGAGNTIDARGFELQRKELQALSVEMGRQASAAAAVPVAPPTPEAKQEKTP